MIDATADAALVLLTYIRGASPVHDAVSASYVRFDHMSLVAAFLAAALHAVTALIVWWVSPLPRHDIEDDAIEITMDEPKPPQETPRPVQEAVKPPPPTPILTPAPAPIRD